MAMLATVVSHLASLAQRNVCTSSELLAAMRDHASEQRLNMLAEKPIILSRSVAELGYTLRISALWGGFLWGSGPPSAASLPTPQSGPRVSRQRKERTRKRQRQKSGGIMVSFDEQHTSPNPTSASPTQPARCNRPIVVDSNSSLAALTCQERAPALLPMSSLALGKGHGTATTSAGMVFLPTGGPRRREGGAADPFESRYDEVLLKQRAPGRAPLFQPDCHGYPRDWNWGITPRYWSRRTATWFLPAPEVESEPKMSQLLSFLAQSRNDTGPRCFAATGAIAARSGVVATGPVFRRGYWLQQRATSTLRSRQGSTPNKLSECQRPRRRIRTLPSGGESSGEMTAPLPRRSHVGE